MREPNPYALDTFTVMQNANRLHGVEHRELLAQHNVNCCDGGDSWLDDFPIPENLTILSDTEAFLTFWMD